MNKEEIKTIGTVGLINGHATFEAAENIGNITHIEAAGMVLSMLNKFKEKVNPKHHEDYDSMFFKVLGMMMDNSEKYSFTIKEK